MAPMEASGVLALSEDTVEKGGWRWRCFTTQLHLVWLLV